MVEESDARFGALLVVHLAHVGKCRLPRAAAAPDDARACGVGGLTSTE